MLPLHQHIEAALESDDARAAIAALPARRRRPALILAALQDLALAGRAPALADALDGRAAAAAARAAVDTLTTMTEAVARVVTRRRLRTVETARCAVLYPAVAEAARRVGASAVGLVDVDNSAGLNLYLDRVRFEYDDGERLGDPASPVRISTAVVGKGRVPAHGLPAVVARIGVDRDPINLIDPDDARWLRACVPPDEPERAGRLEAALAVATGAGLSGGAGQLLGGDAVDLLPGAVDRVPAGVLPVVITTWALSRFSRERRLRFAQRLDAAATDRAVAWVSVEGVGVAPAIPTMGDRPASGHSIVGVAVFEHRSLRAEAVGRCWSRGRLLSWVAQK